ncbi:unnamed protein product, partial [Prorocentrum cordatum]
VQELRKILPCERLFDGCARGLVGDGTGETIEKPWGVIANRQPPQKFLDRRRPQGHGRVQGREFVRKTSKKTGLHTKCGAAIMGFMRGIAGASCALVTLLSDDENEGMGKGPRDIPASLGPERRLTLRGAVAKMHADQGRPGNRALARAIRLAGGSKYEIAAALVHHCPACIKLAAPPSTAASSLRDLWGECGDCLAIDAFELAAAQGADLVFLFQIDMASKCQIIVLVTSREQTVILQAALDSWLLAPGAANVKWLAAAINHAVSSAVGPSGYSPSQWVLGRGIELPCRLLSQRGNPRQRRRMLGGDEPSFRRRVGLFSASKRSVAALEANRKICEAFFAEGRAAAAAPAASTYQVGDQVYYWRGLGKSRAKKHWAARWHGPALVIGRESSVLWLARRDLAVEASARHVRAAGASELVVWKGVLERAEGAGGPAASRPARWSPPGSGGQAPMVVDGEAPQVADPPPTDSGRDETYLDMTIGERAQ